MIRRHSEEEDSYLKDFKQGVNCLLSVADHCLSSENYVNVIVCDKQKRLQFLSMDQAITHCTKGIGRWEPACNDEGVEPDVVMASAGEAPEKRTPHHLSTSGGRVQGLWVTSTLAAGITGNLPKTRLFRHYGITSR
jgi:XFP C-terminal domain